MRKVAWIIFITSIALLASLPVAFYVDQRIKEASNTPTDSSNGTEAPVSYTLIDTPEEGSEKVIPVENIVLTKDLSPCEETEKIRCFKSSATGTIFSYPWEFGYLNVKTRMQYLDYGAEAAMEGNPFECFYEDIQSIDKKLTIYVQGGEITNGNCGTGYGLDVVRRLEFYDTNNNHLYSGYVTSVKKEDKITEKFIVRSASIKPASYVFGDIRIISYSLDTLKTILSTLDMDLHRLRSDYFMAEHTIGLYAGGNVDEVKQYYKDNGFILEE